VSITMGYLSELSMNASTKRAADRGQTWGIVIFFTIALIIKGTSFESTPFSDGLLRFSVALEPEVGFPDDLVLD